MKRRLFKKSGDKSGFTIIETIIVLALVGLIMVVVFVAIPQAQSARRDAHRKAYLRLAFQSVLEYYKNNRIFPACVSQVNACTHGSINATAVEARRFLLNYMPPGERDPSTGKLYVDNTASSCGAATVCSGSTTYQFDGASTNHSLVPRLGEIRINSVHWCYATEPDDGNPSNPIASRNENPERLQFDKVVMLIGTEKGRFFCLDNHFTS